MRNVLGDVKNVGARYLRLTLKDTILFIDGFVLYLL